MNKRNEISIIGGGLAGLTMATALAHAGISCNLIEYQDLHNIDPQKLDGRCSAIAWGSHLFFKDIGIWDAFANDAGPILDIRVSDDHSHCYVHFDHQLAGDNPMGYMIPNYHMLHGLYAYVKDHPFIKIYSPASIDSISYHPTHVDLTLDQGQQLQSSLVIAADGKFSRTRKDAGIDVDQYSYDHSGIVCTIRHEKPHEGLAGERFLPTGPFASLPLKDPYLSSLVWTEKHALIDYYMGMDDETFCTHINQRLQSHLGDITLASKRFSYPLSLSLAKTYHKDRLILLGDAAHGIHPLAGQGFNLGIRDAKTLYDITVKAHELGLDLGCHHLLDDYTALRRFDALSLAAITDGLNRLFLNQNPLVVGLRRTGLAAVNRFPGLKRQFMKHAMGLTQS